MLKDKDWGGDIALLEGLLNCSSSAFAIHRRIEDENKGLVFIPYWANAKYLALCGDDKALMCLKEYELVHVSGQERRFKHYFDGVKRWGHLMIARLNHDYVMTEIVINQEIASDNQGNEHYLEAELYENIQKDRSIFDFIESATLDGIWYWDLERPEHEWMSPRFWETLGYDPRERKHLAREWQDIIDPEDLKKATENFIAHCEDPNHPYDQMVRYRHKNGAIKWIRCRGMALRDPKGKPIRMLGAHVDLTQIKAYEHELKEALWRFKALFEEGPVGVAYHHMLYDVSGKPVDYYFIDANKTYKALTGVNPIGKTVKEAFPGIENDSFDWIGTFGHVAKTGQTIRFEQYLQANQRWYDCVAYQYKQDHFVAMFIEVTEQKRAERALFETQERFMQISQTVEEVFYLVTPDNSEMLYVNPAYETIWGRSCQSLYENPKSFLDAIHEEDRENVLHAFNKGIRTGLFDLEYRVVRPNGDIRWVRSRSHPVKNSKGDVYRHAGTAVDITEYKMTQQQLNESLKDLLESQRIAHIGTWRLNVKTNAVLWSEELYKMYLFDPSQPVPPYTEHMKLFTPESWDRLSHALEQTRTRGIPYELELMTVTKEGTNGWMWVRGEAEKNELGEIVAIWGAAQDISVYKQVEQELIEAKEAAEAASAAKSQFLSNMSHEIRTPMNGFIGILQLLEREGLSEEQKELIDIATVSAHSLLALVNDILDYSKIEAGKLALENEVFDLKALVDETVALFSISARAKGISLTYDIERDTPRELRGDAFRLKQVLSNLLGNAIKFTHEGFVHVSVRLAFTNAEGQASLAFKVKDTGIGIDKVNQPKLFKRFHQVDNSNTRLYGGSGLGLSICKGLVEKMGGRIWFESQAYAGSTFFFTCLCDLVTEQGISVVADEGVKPMTRKKITLLVAEDDEVSQVIMTKLALKNGWQIVLAKNGKEALEAFKKHAFDLIFMDVQMPVMNGYEATAHIRELEKNTKRRVPIIALTAYALQGDAERCLQAGMDDYLTKPLNFKRVHEVVSKWTVTA